MRGFLGQYVAVIPEENLVVVRLGRKEERLPAGDIGPPNSFNMFIKEVLNNYK